MPTKKAHLLLEYADTQGRQHELHEVSGGSWFTGVHDATCASLVGKGLMCVISEVVLSFSAVKELTIQISLYSDLSHVITVFDSFLSRLSFVRTLPTVSTSRPSQSFGGC